jgi:hypothetical protein
MAHRLKQQGNILSAPLRRPFPKNWKRDDTKIPQGKIIYLRRTDGNGHVYLLEQKNRGQPKLGQSTGTH